MNQAIDNEGRFSQQLDRLCNHLVAKKSYAVLGVVDGDTAQLCGVGVTDDYDGQLADIPELVPLLAHFDRILVRLDGYSFTAICIKNRQAGASNALSVSLDELKQIGQTCLKYTGKIQGSKMPVMLQVFEVTDLSHAEVEHLQSLRCIPGLKQKVGVTAWSLNLSNGTVWTNTRFNGLLAGRRFLEQTLAAVATGANPAVERMVPIGTDIRYPVLTYGLVGLMGVIFILQLVLGDFEGFLSPTVPSLIALGGLFQPLIREGEWYRLFMAAFLHGGLLHIVLNGLALFLGGMLLESWLGRAWFLSIFALSILGGSAASLLLNDPGIVSVGASGAIMGMLATALMVTFRLPYGQERTSAMMNLIYWLIPALIPLTTSRSGNQIDFAAHFGGAMTGFVLGAVILKTWAEGHRLPRFGKAAMIMAGISVVLIGISMTLAFSNHRSIQEQFSLSAQVADDEAFQRLDTLSPDEAESTLTQLRETYPRDPRTLFFSALTAVDNNQLDDAKLYLERGLAETPILNHIFTNGTLEVGMRVLLVEILRFEQADSEASKVLKPVCGHLTDDDEKRLDSTWVKTVCSP